MRLRDFVLRLSLGGAGALAREDYTTARPSSPSFSALGFDRCQAEARVVCDT